MVFNRKFFTFGGYEDLLSFFGKEVKGKDETSYAPINAVFGTTILMAIQKLRDLDSFSNQFITYDILGRRWVRYAYIYPFVEMIAGVGMLSMLLPTLFGGVSLIIGTIGAISVVKAVYVDKRDLKCACVGGDSNVPLGAISLTENVMMVLMGLWMIFRYGL